MINQRTLEPTPVVVLAVALLSAGGAGAEEFSYRDLAPQTGPRSDAPLIPHAATRRPSLSRASTFSVPSQPAPASSSDGLIPLALSHGSEAAKIFQRNQQRLGLISKIFSKMRNSVEETERAERERQAALERRRAEERRAAEVAEARRLELEREEQERLARQRLEAQAQARLRAQAEAAQKARITPPAFAEPRPRAAPAPRTAAASPSSGSYQVVPGDSLIAIARKVYGTQAVWKQLAAANGLTEKSTLKVGQTIQTPAGLKPPKPRSWRVAKALNSESEQRLDYSKFEFKLYNVQAGDTLSGISSRHYGTIGKVDLIRQYNTKVLARGLRAGDKLTIPVERNAAHEDRYQKAREGVF